MFSREGFRRAYCHVRPPSNAVPSARPNSCSMSARCGRRVADKFLRRRATANRYRGHSNKRGKNVAVPYNVSVSKAEDVIESAQAATLRLRTRRHHTLSLWIAGVLQACVLLLTAAAQIYDTNFNTLAETPGLLAGDLPSRYFFDWGVPLQAALSATMQWLVGYRLVGEFALQWAFIVAGLVMAMRIGLRLSNSLAALSICLVPAILIFPGVPTVHYSKMFIYPAAILIIWRYIEDPTVQRAAAMGACAAVAFFLRHDHGVYVGTSVLLGIVLAWLAHSENRRPRALVHELVACALAAIVLVAPWAIVVARSEGLLDYVQARAFINSKW